VTGRWTGRGLFVTGHVQSVFSVCACFSFLIGRVRSIWELTGLQPDASTVASGQFCSTSSRCFVRTWLRLDQRVRSVTGPARPVILCASSPRDQRVRSVLRESSRCVIGASGPCDQRVWSARLQLNLVPNGYIRRGTSIYTCWPAQSSPFLDI
jgi:hypothetical protein